MQMKIVLVGGKSAIFSVSNDVSPVTDNRIDRFPQMLETLNGSPIAGLKSGDKVWLHSAGLQMSGEIQEAEILPPDTASRRS